MLERVSVSESSARYHLRTHQIRQAGIEVLQVFRVDEFFRIVLHPQAHLAETVGPDQGIPIPVTMHKEPGRRSWSVRHDASSTA